MVLTGRDAPRELIEIADTVTEMKKVKHAYDKGVMARRGSTIDSAGERSSPEALISDAGYGG